MYPSERAALLASRFGGEFTDVDAAEVFGRHLADVDTDDVIDCTARDRTRIFNLGYYTWVEQQGTPFELFEQRRSQSFWRGPAPLPRGVGRDDHRVQRTRRLVVIVGWRCAVCGTTVDVATPYPFTCPRATPTDRAPRAAPARRRRRAAGRCDDPNPFVAYGPRLAWWAFAAAARHDRGGVRRADTASWPTGSR